MKLTQTTGPNLGGQKQNGRKNSTFFKEISTFLEAWEKETSNTVTLKKKIFLMKRQENTAQMKEQTRSREVQINVEEIGKSPGKELRIMIVKMIKNLVNKMEKMQESINKDLEELKNKHTETNNTISEIKNKRNQ